MSPEEIEAWWAEVAALTEPTVTEQIEYRLYYDERGDIVSCSMQSHPAEGSYVVVEKPIYDTYFLYRIKNGQPVKIDFDNTYRVLLERSSTGFCVVRNHAGLVLEENEQAGETEFYAYRNN
jgi:hypothetical protein